MAHCDALSQYRRSATNVMRSLGQTLFHTFRLFLAFALLSANSVHAEPPRAANTLGIGLAGISDWSTQQPFLDVMKTARPWIGHLPNQWGGLNASDLQAAGILDNHGWPTSIPTNLRGIGTVILTDLPPEAASLAGRYRLRFEGSGIIEVSGRASKVKYGEKQIEFDFIPGEGSVVVTINRTDNRKTGDYIRGISVVKLEKAPLFESGGVFNPDWLKHVQDFEVLRYMDWMSTNDSNQSKWDDRPHVDDYTYAHGVPVEVMVRLSNETGTNPWFNIPHLATDEYVKAFAETVFATLDPKLTAYVEFSNEVWNWQFEQASWAEDEGSARWGKEYSWMQYYGMRSAEVLQIWSEVYTNARSRLITIISTQTGWQGLEFDALEAPLWRAENPQNPRPAELADAFAIAGYFGRIIGTPERAQIVREWLAESQARAGSDQSRRFEYAIEMAVKELRDGSVTGDPRDTLRDLAENTFPYQAKVANKFGLDLIMYEGGTHVTGIEEILDDDGLTDFFIALNYSPGMGELYSELLDIWHQAGGQVFNAYADVIMPSKWGSWGHLRHLEDDNGRWRALKIATGN